MLTILSLLSLASAADGAFPYNVQTEVLDNGLTVHVIPMNTPNVAAVYTWFAVGSRDEVDPGRTGFAHFFEHLMFYGTPTFPGDHREQVLLQMGAEDNAWTWLDETVYHTVLPTSGLPALLEIEGDRFANLQLTAEDVQKESGAVYGEFRKGQASPSNAVGVALYQTAFTTHTYQHDTIGYEDDIAAMPDAFEYSQRFLNTHYRPGKATLLVAGDVQAQTVFAQVRKGWSSWPAENPNAPAEEAEERPTIQEEPAQTEMREISVSWPTPTAPLLSMGWKIPASSPQNPDVIALQAVADVLFSPVGPLKRRLVREEALAYAVYGWRSDNVDPSLFTIQVELKDVAGLAQAEQIIREEIANLARVDAELLARTQSHERYSFQTGLQDPNAVASALGWFLRRHPDPAGLNVWWSAYADLQPADLARVADLYLIDAGLTRAVLKHESIQAVEVK